MEQENMMSPSKGTNVSQKIADAFANPEKFGDYLKPFKSVRNSPFIFSSENLHQELQFYVHSLMSNTEGLNAEGHKQLRNEFLSFENSLSKFNGEFKVLAAVIESGIGTHTAKIPDANVKGPTVKAEMSVLEKAKRHNFVSSATINAEQTVGASGNAATMKYQKFLAMRYVLNGEASYVYEDIMSKGAFYEALCAIGISRDELEKVSELLNAVRKPDTHVPTGNKSLIWPTDDGDVVISPLHPFVIHLELNERMWALKRRGNFFHESYFKVGGTQPQNAGFINSDMGGKHILLSALPPASVSKLARKFYAVAATKTLGLKRISQSSAEFKTLVGIIKRKDNVNAEGRADLADAIDDIISLMLTPFNEYSDFLHNAGEEIKGDEINSPTWGQNYVQKIPMSERMISQFKKDIVDAFNNLIPDALKGDGETVNALNSIYERHLERVLENNNG